MHYCICYRYMLSVCIIVRTATYKKQSNDKARFMGNPLFYITWVAMGACEALMASGDIQY